MFVSKRVAIDKHIDFRTLLPSRALCFCFPLRFTALPDRQRPLRGAATCLGRRVRAILHGV